MTRQTCFVMSLVGVIALIGLSPATYAQHQWTSLDGPYWANGIDVAYGKGGGTQAWHRYVIGTDGDVKKLFYWRESDARWRVWDELPAPNRMISYKGPNDNGDNALCTNYNDRLWMTENGGVSWDGIPGSETLPNKQFSTLEIDESDPDSRCFVGSLGMTNEASVYEGVLSGGNWDWSPVADGLEDLDVKDLEFPLNTWLVAGTDDGIWRIQPANPSWERANGDFAGVDITALDELGEHNEMWAATGTVNGHRRLYYSGTESGDPWNSYAEVQPEGVPFDKVVNDISAVFFTDLSVNYQSVYIAAEDGLYLLDMHGTNSNTPVYEFVNFQEDTEYFQNSPFRYDNRVRSVDFYRSSRESLTRYILAGTAYNIYLITETRSSQDRSLESIEVSEIVTGTYKCNVVDLSLAEHGSDPNGNRIFALSENGLVKKWYDQTWRFVGTAFDVGELSQNGSSIAVDFVGSNQLILAASIDGATGGTVMFSSDGGDSWINKTPTGNPQVISLDLEPGEGRYAFAASENHVWVSDDDGQTWSTPQYFPNSSFNDILAEPDPNSTVEGYVGGSGTQKAFKYENNSWAQFDNGLQGVVEINEFTKSPYYGQLFAATTNGIFKNVDGVWYQKIFGMGEINLGTIVVDPYVSQDQDFRGYPGFLAASSADVIPSAIWASLDSSRSWNEMFMNEIGSSVSVNRLSATKENVDVWSSGFVVGTSDGVFYIGDIFKQGGITLDEEEWGPGVIFVPGDVIFFKMQYQNGTVDVVAPCTVFVAYEYDARNLSYDFPDRSEIAVLSNYHLVADGDPENRIVFQSSRPGGGEPGDWGGIGFGDYYASVYPYGINLDNCEVRHADKGIYSRATGVKYIDSLLVSNCQFEDMSFAGIDAKPAVDSMLITLCSFQDCSDYGIRFTEAFDPSGGAIPMGSMHIKSNQIGTCDNGIYFTGNYYAEDDNVLYLRSNSIQLIPPYQGGEDGIYVNQHYPEHLPPVTILTGNLIKNFATGIHLSSVANASELQRNTAEENSNYGIMMQYSSPTIVGDNLGRPNEFKMNGIGIYCDEHSSPYIRQTRIKDNVIGGVLIESHDMTADPPADFGTSRDWGNNALSRADAPGSYYDMKYMGLSTRVSAIRNWWGEPDPVPAQIVGNIDYIPYLTEDPLSPYPKREPWYANLPDQFGLNQNFPNPFNPTANISFYLADPGFASLKIYNLNGQLVKTLYSGLADEGEHTIVWDGKNGTGMDVASGIYFYILATDEGKASKKMVLLR
jgi:parallel beta-helix repeat protein